MAHGLISSRWKNIYKWPKNVTSQEGYPQSKTEDAVFTVITDDGWSFKCKVSGDYSKNFRS